jgi:branched-chain amino acid transport system substrate-binding protein
MNRIRHTAVLLAALASTSLVSDLAHAQYTDGVVKIGVLTDFSSLYADITGPGSVAAAKCLSEKLLNPTNRL